MAETLIIDHGFDAALDGDVLSTFTEDGIGYVNESSPSNDFSFISGRIYRTGGIGGPVYRIARLFSTGEYRVQADYYARTAGLGVRVACRIDGGRQAYFEFAGVTGRWRLVENAGAGSNVLFNWDGPTVTAGQTGTFGIRSVAPGHVDPPGVYGYKNGAQVAFAATSLPDTGKVGVSSSNAGSTSGIQVAGLRYYETTADPPAPPTGFATPTQFGSAYVDTDITTGAGAATSVRYYAAPVVGGLPDAANKVLVGTVAAPAPSTALAYRLKDLTLAAGDWFFGASEYNGAESAITWAPAAITLPTVDSFSNYSNDFTDPADPRFGDWTDDPQNTVVQTTGLTGQLTIHRSAGLNAYAGRADDDVISLQPGDFIYMRMDASAWNSDASSDTGFVLKRGDNDQIAVYLMGSSLRAYVEAGGVVSVDEEMAVYNAATHRWIRIERDQAGNLRWLTAPDDTLGTGPGTWTLRRSKPDTIFTPGYDRLHLGWYGGAFSTTSAAGDVSYDGVNGRTTRALPPAEPTAGTATPNDSTSLTLPYTDNSTDETRFQFLTAPVVGGAPDEANAVVVDDIATPDGPGTGPRSRIITGLVPGATVWPGVRSAGPGGPSAISWATAAVDLPNPPNLIGITSPKNGAKHSAGDIWAFRVDVTDVDTHEWKSNIHGVFATTQNPDVAANVLEGTDTAPAEHIVTYTGSGPGGTVAASITIQEGILATQPSAATPIEEDDDMRKIPWGDTRPQPISLFTTDGSVFTSALAVGDVQVDLQDGNGWVNVVNLPVAAAAGGYYEWTPDTTETSRNRFALRIQKEGVRTRPPIFFQTTDHPDAFDPTAEAYGTLAADAVDGAPLISVSNVAGTLARGNALVLSPSGARAKIAAVTSTGVGTYDLALAGGGLVGAAGAGEAFASYLDLPTDKVDYNLSATERTLIQQAVNAATPADLDPLTTGQQAIQEQVSTLSTFDHTVDEVNANIKRINDQNLAGDGINTKIVTVA